MSERTGMNEHQCYALMIEHLRGARDCMRGMAQLRGDARWLVPVQLMDRIMDQMGTMMKRGGSRLLWLPNRTKP